MAKKTILIASLLALLSQTTFSHDTNLPDLGENADATLSLAKENQIGHEAWMAMQEAGDLVDDPEINAYINQVGQRLANAANLPNVHFRYFCVNDNTINAFAMPGGYVGINTGLFLATQSESELAAVLAHETAHVAQRHIARMQAANQAISPLILLGTIVAAAAASKAGGSDAAVGAVSAGMGLSISKQLSFSRDFEREADRVGMHYMVQAGFDPRTMADFFQRLQKTERYSDNSAYAFLSTHPVTTERISEAENRAMDYPVKMLANSTNYLLAREKLRLLTMTADKAKNYYENALKNGLYLDEGAQWYGLARAQLALKQPEKAQQALNKARSFHSSNPMFYTLAADIDRAEKKWDQANQTLTQGITTFPNAIPLRLAQIDLAIDSGAKNKALTLIQQQLENHPDQPDLYLRQAKLYVDNDALHYHAALGNAYYFQQRYPKAMEQYQLASSAKGNDFYIRSAVDARLKELKRRLKEQKNGQ